MHILSLGLMAVLNALVMRQKLDFGLSLATICLLGMLGVFERRSLFAIIARQALRQLTKAQAGSQTPD